MLFGGGWRGAPHIKGLGMLVVLLRGVNFGFWSHGVLGKTLLYLAVKISFRVARAKICVLSVFSVTVSFRGQKSLGYSK